MLVDKSALTEGSNTAKHLSFMENKKCYTEYSYEILECFFLGEKNLIKIRKKSDQLNLRPNLVYNLQQFARAHEYSLATLHLGVYILDVYMDNYIISDYDDHQKLVGLVCLLLAAKSEDLDDKVPSIKELLRIVDLSEDLGFDPRCKEEVDPKVAAAGFQNFSVMYGKLEYLILESLDFNTIRPTVVNFINIFQNIVLSESDIKDIEKSDYQETETVFELKTKVNEYLKSFLSIILNDISFFNILPSKVAAAIVCATRKLLGIKNLWPDYIFKLTSHKEDEVRSLAITLLEMRIASVYKKKNDEDEDMELKDSGFISIDSDSEQEEEKLARKKRKLNRVGITYGVVEQKSS